mgnify:CR=1 FL=1
MPIQVKACPSCNRQLAKASGIAPRYWCSSCKVGYLKSEVEVRTKYRNLNREKSDKHEKKAAKKIRGRQTPASGAMAFNKADVYSDLVRMECKTTEKKSYSIKKDLLLKVAGETEHGKIPVFNIQFEGIGSHLNYYVIDEGFFLELLDLWRKENED